VAHLSVPLLELGGRGGVPCCDVPLIRGYIVIEKQLGTGEMLRVGKFSDEIPQDQF
jgi:hypothetical protein